MWVSKFCGISAYSVIGWLKLEGRTSSSLINKQGKAKIIDIAIPGDAQVKDKELEKIEKYQLLREEIGKMWRL